MTSEPSNKKNKRRLLLLLGVVIVGAIVIFGIWLLMRSHPAASPATTPVKNAQASDPELHKELNTAQAALDKEKQKSQQLSGNKSLAHAYLNLAAAQYNVQDTSSAVSTYELLVSNVDSFKDNSLKQDILRGAYATYAANGQRQKAIDTCQQLIDFLRTESDNPYVGSSIAAYQSDLKLLKEGKSL